MRKRFENYNEKIRLKLQNPTYARELLRTLMEGPDGLSPEEALKNMIEVMGSNEFSLRGLRKPNA